ncbi:MAG TPA: xanthine dehydrogenase family protein subunit M [Thermodesulfobacteriota bacterium]|nr:xanthine dehydrogenase family protein subunit M [Thermodesulfobacteriota bacterium]
MFLKRLPKFEYHVPTSLPEALDLLAQHDGKARVLAGGTDLLVSMKKREVLPEHLISLKGIAEMKGIQDEKEGMKIGALVTLGEIEHSKIIQERYRVLWDAVQVMASLQVRSLGTIGGNLCSAAPSADTAPPLIVLDASVEIISSNGKRKVLVEKFFKGPGESVLIPGEILTQITIPNPVKKSGGAYLKLMRRAAMDLAQVGIAAWLSIDSEKRTCRGAKIALGAVGSTPIRALKAEQVLLNKELNETVGREAGKIAAQEANPRSSMRASKEYRREMIEVLTKRAVMEAYKRID